MSKRQTSKNASGPLTRESVAARAALPANTCTKWPHRACGGRCEDKTCCFCQEEYCNRKQMCSAPGRMPNKCHQKGWPEDPAAETDGSAGTPAVPEGSGESRSRGTPRPPEASPAALVPAVVQHAALEVADLATATAEIRGLISAGRRAATRIAVLIAQVRELHFKDDAKGWEAWAKREFGYERRFCFACLKAGNWLVHHGALLPPARRESLEQVDLRKLEYISCIPEQRVDAFLDRHQDLADLDRKQVKRLAKAWEMGRPIGEIEAEEEKAAEERKAKAVDPVTAFERVARDAEKVANGTSPKCSHVVGTIDAGKALLGGLSLTVIGVLAQKNRPSVTRKDMEDAVAMLDRIRGQLTDMIEAAK